MTKNSKKKFTDDSTKSESKEQKELKHERIVHRRHHSTNTSMWENVTLWKGVSAVLAVILIIFLATGAPSVSKWSAGGFIANMGANNADGPGANNAEANANNGDTINIVEFSDFECPFCERAVPTVNALKAKYGDRLNLEFKHFPLSFHPNAQKAAEASECARDQGKFWEYHDALFDGQKLSIADLKQHAVDLGLDTTKFNSCLDNGDKADVVTADFNEGRAKGVSGTPTFFVNGQKVVGAQPIEAFEAVINGEAQAAPEQVAPPPTPSVYEYEITDGDWVEGDDSAPVTIIEWSDFECPYCERFYSSTLSKLRTDYIETGKVKLIFRHFPLSFHVNAKPTAIASECAGQQGKFWELHDFFFTERKLSATDITAEAENLGLDMDAFNTCLTDTDVEAKVQADFLLGQKSGVTGTPGFLVNGKPIKGAQPFEVFKAAIDAELAAAE